MKIALLLICLLMNGFFAMAEIALVRSKKSRLERLAREGKKRAAIALKLLDRPGQFLAAVQVGVTLASIFAGAVGASEFTPVVSKGLEGLGMPEHLSKTSAFMLLVVLISYLTLVLGELIPKKLAMLHPEKIALFVSPVMFSLAKGFAPLVWFLNLSSEVPLKLLGLKKKKEPEVTEQEIADMLDDGLAAGVIERYEHRVISQVFRLSDLPVTSLMTPRVKVEAIDRKTTDGELRELLSSGEHISYPVYDGSLDNVTGFIHTQDVLKSCVNGGGIDIGALLKPALIIPESMNSLDALRMFQRKKSHLGIIVDEYGGVKGIVTLRDFLRAIMSEFSGASGFETPFRRRGDGSWVISGSVSIESIAEKLGIEVDEEKKTYFRTLGGLILYRLGRVPKEGDHLVYRNYKLEVLDMDGNRIDKVLVMPVRKGAKSGKKERAE